MRLVISCCVLLGLLLALDDSRQRGIREEKQAALAAIRVHEGLDLSRLSRPGLESLTRRISKLIPQRDYSETLFFGYTPERVWTTPGNKRPMCLLFETQKFLPHPGTTPIRITVFDHLGTPLLEQAFSTGHRCYLQEVTLEFASESHSPKVVLNTHPGPGLSPDIGRQVYEMEGGRFVLVRLEDADGFATRNGFYVTHFRCGPPTPSRSDAEWESDVHSAERVKILRSLVWLGGIHRTANPKTGPNETESRAELQSVQRVRANPRVIERLKELSASEDRWLREAAILAANPEDARW